MKTNIILVHKSKIKLKNPFISIRFRAVNCNVNILFIHELASNNKIPKIPTDSMKNECSKPSFMI